MSATHAALYVIGLPSACAAALWLLEWAAQTIVRHLRTD
jgi:hypothetical protein